MSSLCNRGGYDDDADRWGWAFSCSERDIGESASSRPLSALVIGSTIGSGVFRLPQNMVAGAGPPAVAIGWGITAVGVLAPVFVYQSLAVRKPRLDAGPYVYAKAGFGQFVGFNSAWGY